ncbi:MAG: hypothetical protein KDA85_22960, partial [Planctomycetaceae bacterium]|nr:hypothetical protein [Planctomycetaceae bacterium]
MGIFIVLSLLPLCGLLLTLNSQLDIQAEKRFRDELHETANAIHRDLEGVAPDAAAARWHESLRGRPFQYWVVTTDGRELSHSTTPAPNRPAVRSVILNAFQFGASERWIEEYQTHRRVMLFAIRCSPGPTGERILLVNGIPSPNSAPERIAAQIATRSAIFTWLACVLCVAAVAAGLVSPLRAMTRNLEVTAQEVERRDMLLRISDRRDELGEVAQSLTILESERQQQLTDLRDADLRSRSSVEMLSAVLDAMVEGVVAVDESERILFINAGARRLMSVTNAIQPGKWFFEAIRVPSVLETVSEAI